MNATARFCTACGHPRNPNAKFCGHCGSAFEPGTAPATAATSHWQVAVGGELSITQPKPKKKKKTARPAVAKAPSPKAKSLWGSTLFMAITQGADLMTRALESNSPQDDTLYLRLGLAAAVAVFGVTLGSTPRLRMILVRLGTLAIGVLQGASLWGQVQGLALDPQILQAAMPNLGAQTASILAVLRLFRQAGIR